MPLIKVEDPLRRTAFMVGTFTVILFAGQLLIGEGSVLSRLVRSVIAGAVFGVVLLWLNLRAARKRQAQ